MWAGFFIPVTMSDVEAQEHFDDFFEEIFTELEDKVKCWSSYLYTRSLKVKSKVVDHQGLSDCPNLVPSTVKPGN